MKLGEFWFSGTKLIFMDTNIYCHKSERENYGLSAKWQEKTNV